MSDVDTLNAKLKPGDALANGKYVVTGRIGAGAMGTVYAGEHRALKRKVAIKVMRPEVFENKPKAAKRFQREARAAAQLDHRHSVRVLDFGSEGPLHYLVMEYVEGRPLDRVIAEDGPMSSDRAARLVAQVCGALSKAHGEGTIHRDLKPQNILLLNSTDDEGFPVEEVKVCDFGIAKVSWSEPDDGEEALTEAGRVIGTPQYMSPEQCQAEEVDHRSDLYSVGCVMYFLVAGQHAFSGPTPLTTMLMHIQEPAPAPSHVNPEVDARFEQLVLWAMQKEPDKRPLSAGELKRYLYEITGQESSQGEIPATQPAPKLSGRPAHQADADSSDGTTPTPSESAAANAPVDDTAPSSMAAQRGLMPAIALLCAALLLSVAVFALSGGQESDETNAEAATPTAVAPASPEPAKTVATPDTETRAPEVKNEAAAPPSKDAEPTPKPPKAEAKAATAKPTAPAVSSAANTEDVSKPTHTPPARKPKRAKPTKAKSTGPSKDEKPGPSTASKPTVREVTSRPEPPTPKAPIQPEPVAKAPSAPVIVTPKAPTNPPSKAGLKSFKASVRISGVTVRGSLPKSVIVKAAKRLRGEFAKCYATSSRGASQTPVAKLTVKATIDVDGRARRVRVSASRLPGLSKCVKARAKRLRSGTPPDTGTVETSFEVQFVPKS